jgi:hypothetical protein
MLAVVVAAVCLLLTACGDGGGSGAGASEMVWADEPPFPPASLYLADASRDDMWVVHNQMATARADEPWFAVRRGDGKWAELPDPPKSYLSTALASVSGDVVLGGVVCDDTSDCSSGYTEWSVLAEDLSAWNVIDADLPFKNDREAVITSMPGRHDIGVFSTPSGRVVIDADHEVRPIPSRTGAALGDGAACIVGSTLFESFASYTNLNNADGTGAIDMGEPTMSTLDLSDPAADWRSTPTPPDGVGGLEAACLDDGVLFLDDGVETVFNIDTATWTRTPEPSGGLLAGRSLELGQTSSVLTGDGTLYLVTGSGSTVLRRSPDGTWSDTGTFTTAIASTEATALALNADGTDVTEIPPN